MKRIVQEIWNPNNLFRCGLCGVTINDYLSFHISEDFDIDVKKLHKQSVFNIDDKKVIPVVVLTNQQKYHICCDCWESIKHMKKSEIYDMFEEKEKEP